MGLNDEAERRLSRLPRLVELDDAIARHCLLAMSQHRLGKRNETRQSLARLRSVYQQTYSSEKAPVRLAGLVAESERLVGERDDDGK